MLKSKYIYINATATSSKLNSQMQSYPQNSKRFNGKLSCTATNGYYVDHSLSQPTGSQVPPPQFQIYPVDAIKLNWEAGLRVSTGVGLSNLGNTCFLNSILQVLVNTPPLVNYLCSDHHGKQSCPSQMGYCAICALKQHVKRVHIAAKCRQDSLSPQFIVQKLRCVMKSHSFGRQQDAHEFLRYFVDAMQNASLHMFKDKKCNKKVSAHKNYTIHVPPNVLTLQLKRFDHFGKIDKNVSFPEKLNIRPYMSQKQGAPINYKLYGVVVHAGRSTNSGHYYSFVRNPLDQWHLMDDSRVITSYCVAAERINSSVCVVNAKNVLQTAAYILFYIRSPLQVSTVKPHSRPPAQVLSPNGYHFGDYDQENTKFQHQVDVGQEPECNGRASEYRRTSPLLPDRLDKRQSDSPDKTNVQSLKSDSGGVPDSTHYSQNKDEQSQEETVQISENTSEWMRPSNSGDKSEYNKNLEPASVQTEAIGTAAPLWEVTCLGHEYRGQDQRSTSKDREISEKLTQNCEEHDLKYKGSLSNDNLEIGRNIGPQAAPDYGDRKRQKLKHDHIENERENQGGEKYETARDGSQKSTFKYNGRESEHEGCWYHSNSLKLSQDVKSQNGLLDKKDLKRSKRKCEPESKHQYQRKDEKWPYKYDKYDQFDFKNKCNLLHYERKPKSGKGNKRRSMSSDRNVIKRPKYDYSESECKHHRRDRDDRGKKEGKLSRHQKRREEKKKKRKLKKLAKLEKRKKDIEIYRQTGVQSSSTASRQNVSLLTPLEFLKNFCSSKVKTWDNTLNPSYDNSNSEQVKAQERDNYNDEYDAGRKK